MTYVKPKVWTEDEELDLIFETKTGMTATQIAKLHGRTRGAIQQRQERLGLIKKAWIPFKKKTK